MHSSNEPVPTREKCISEAADAFLAFAIRIAQEDLDRKNGWLPPTASAASESLNAVSAPDETISVMTNIPEPGRQAAHIILDAVIAYEPGLPDDIGTNSMNLALERLNEIGAVSAAMDDNDHLKLDISNLAGGMIVATNWLVHRLAEARSVTPELVVSDLRAFLDD